MISIHKSVQIINTETGGCIHIEEQTPKPDTV
jgi:hypothetical protein